MIFEEEFPSLKGKKYEDWDAGEYGSFSGIRKTKEGYLILLDDVGKHCLDKQRVREAIKKAKEQLDFKHDYHNSCESMGSIQFIEKELGLEDRK